MQLGFMVPVKETIFELTYRQTHMMIILANGLGSTFYAYTTGKKFENTQHSLKNTC